MTPVATKASTGLSVLVPPARVRYLAEISDTVRAYHEATATEQAAVRAVDQLDGARQLAAGKRPPTTSARPRLPAMRSTRRPRSCSTTS
jgi:methylmalonyl-CoA mutase